MLKLQIKYRSRFSTEKVQSPTPSYFHRLGDEPLKYYSIGQILKQAALKYPDRQSIVSCMENSQLTFAELLDKVNKKTKLRL